MNTRTEHQFFQNPQIGVVNHFNELINTQFQGSMNALCWQRDLSGDFKEIVTQLLASFANNLKAATQVSTTDIERETDGLVSQSLDNQPLDSQSLNRESFEDDLDPVLEISSDDLLALKLTPQGEIARDIILKDMQQLEAYGASPCLNLIHHYQRDDEFDFISTDVYSYHVDRSPIATDTFLCTYHGAASDIISNDQVQQKVLIPDIRAQLKALHEGPDSEFEQFLAEYFFDLHYQALPNATPINLGLGHLWRLAVDHPTQQVLPCVHRAPVERDGEYRLLLIC